MQAILKWVDIDRVLPNPKNPRKDHSIKTKEMQEIIKSKGWEEGITVYESNQYFVILSGHRRWHAAKKIGETQVPLFIVKPPENDAEELDRLGSVQGGQVDWNPYELAKYTYDIWKIFGEISYTELAKKLGITKNLVATRIRVYQYYDSKEVEGKLENGMYSITMLDYIITWIKRLIKYQPELVVAMKEDYIKQLMLRKYENKCFNSKIVHDNVFVTHASPQEISDFLTDSTKKLSDCQMEFSMRYQTKHYDIVENCMEITTTINEIKKLKWRDKNQAQKLGDGLRKLLEEVDKRIEDLDSSFNVKERC